MIHMVTNRRSKIMAVSLTRKSPRPQPTKINVALLHVYVSPSVALRLGVAPSSNLSDRPADPADYSDGYGGTYAKGE
jgi:hypothetical protein